MARIENQCKIILEIIIQAPFKASNLSQSRLTYDLVVIGGGAGGLVTAATAKSLGAKVALIEK